MAVQGPDAVTSSAPSIKGRLGAPVQALEDTMEKTTKERNTQRRKRRIGLEKKAFFLSELCGLDVALLIYNPEEDSYYTFRSSERDWLDIPSIVSGHIHTCAAQQRSLDLVAGAPEIAE